MAKIFVSYTSKDKDWAFWLAQELEKLGHVPHVHEWEIPAGGNIAQWMRERVDDSEHMACLVSCEYLTKVYSGWELESGLWAAVSTQKNFVLPIFVEACEPPRLLAPFKRCDLYGLSEEDARGRLAEYLSSGLRPPGPMRFPGGAKPAGLSPERTAPVTFPGIRKPRSLPLASLGDLFKGRDDKLKELRAALEKAKGAGVVVRALQGLGGVGKTRLAIEYAWAHVADYSALLFVRAENAASLNAGLAALAGASVLDLPEKEAREDETRIEAVLRWLEANPTWLLILDNVDDPDAVKAVKSVMPRFKGGHVVVTARAANFPPSVRKLELDVLDEDAAAAFLLQRNGRSRSALRPAPGRAQARRVRAPAHGPQLRCPSPCRDHRLGFGRYLKLWSENRDATLAWNDPTLTGSEKTLATTWATSVERLSPESRRLLDRLAFLAPDPIPDSLLDVAVPGEAEGYDALKARAGLFACSLATRAKGENGKGFVVHRLVQDFARRAMAEERAAEVLREALEWVNAAVPFDSDDVRMWPVLDPLAPHALAVSRRADQAGIAEPTARLFNQLGLLFWAKARYGEAEPLMRRALALYEVSLGPDHPFVATGLNNLAALLRETGRFAEAEPFCRRALAIDEASFGTDHPEVAVDLNNLAQLLQATNRLDEAEPLFRRAPAIGEASSGPDHPQVAIRLNNLAE